VRAALLCLVLLLLVAPSAAQDAAGSGTARPSGAPGPWSTRAHTAYAYWGPTKRPTGGMMAMVVLNRSWELSEGLHVSAGGEFALAGFDAGGRWMAILGGITGQIRGRTLWHPLWLGAGLHLDAGRLPECSPWGLCMQYAGIFPAVSASASYSPSPRVTFDLLGTARLIRTLADDGMGWEGGFAGTVLL